MVAMKKSIALAAFAVAGVNADGCCSTFSCKSETPAAVETNKVVEDDAQSATVEVVGQNEEEPTKGKQLQAKCAHATDAVKGKFTEVAGNTKSFVDAQGKKVRNGVEVAAGKFETTFPKTTELGHKAAEKGKGAAETVMNGSRTAFRKANEKREEAVERVTELAAENPKIARAAAALSALGVIGFAGEKFCPLKMDAARTAIINNATKGVEAIENHTPEQVKELLKKFAEKTNVMKDGCVSFCSTQYGNMLTGVSDAVSALVNSKAVKAVKDFGADAQAFGNNHVVVPVKNAAGVVVNYAVHAKSVTVEKGTKAATITAKTFTELKTQSKDMITKALEKIVATFSKSQE